MKILLRHDDENEYVWVDAEYKANGFCRIGTDSNIIETNIVSVMDDDRNKYVICKNCGELIKNNKRSIESHYRNVEDKRNCLKCKKLKEDHSKTYLKKSYVLQDDGNYKITDVYSTHLLCGNSRWSFKDINSEEAKLGCMFIQCRSRGTEEISDIFTKYPGVFDTLITVDTLVENGWQYNLKHNIKYYDIPLLFYTKNVYGNMVRGALNAVVNDLGFVDYFLVRQNRDYYAFIYSVKYDKFFYVEHYSNAYQEGIPSGMSDTRYNEICKKIRNLYKGVMEND